MNKGFFKVTTVFGIFVVALLAGVFLFTQPSVQSVLATFSSNVNNLSDLPCGEQEIVFSGASDFPSDDSDDQYRLRVTLDGNEIYVKDNDGNWTAPAQVVGVGAHTVVSAVQHRELINPPGPNNSYWGSWQTVNFSGDTDNFTIETCPVKDQCDNLEGVQEVVPDGYSQEKTEQGWVCEPSRTPTPEQPGNPPTFAGSSTEAPSCPNGNTTKVVANGHVIRGVNGDFSKAIVNAFLTEGDRVHVYWRIVGQVDWAHSSAAEYKDGIKPNADNFISYPVNELDPNGDYDFGILQANGCGGGTIAVIKDGAESKTFHVTSYE